MVLSEKQKNELNQAIADYLSTSGYTISFKEFCREANISNNESAERKDQLEKKWTSVIRLQKKVRKKSQLANSPVINI
ncbi:unnamed protein product, partial [Rotaria magnacalcarata]